MAFDYLTNSPPETAKREYMAALLERGLAPSFESVPVIESAGRLTGRAVYAALCSPHYHACAMDGVALEARLTFGAGETTPVSLKKGEYIPVDTGDPLPQGCDAVVMIEDVVAEGEGIRLYAAAAPWQHVRQIGEDVCAGDMLLPSFAEISPSAVGAMIAGGVTEVCVVRRPVVGLIPTGDEIVLPKPDPAPGEILEFNSAIFSAMLRSWGAETKLYPIVPDRPELITEALEKAADECDAVILNAGSSAGRDDYAKEAIAAVGEVCCHGLAMKPGKPAVLGLRGPTALLGVPGYPVSGIIVVEELLRPVIDVLLGRPSPEIRRVRALLSRAAASSLKYKEFVRVRLGKVGGRLIATPLNRGAGVVTSFMKADGVMEIPQDSEGFEAGTEVDVGLLRPLGEIESALVVTGSHDPLLDELADLLRISDHSAAMSSAHVGSMGGIMAVKRGECHAAGIHLLDEASGEYNLPYLKKYFPDGGVALVECVRRSQGLMVAPGNPKGIRGMRDIVDNNYSYVNRQKGSGTRVLCDWVCKREGLDAGRIYGYDREEYTHTAVAALVASGSGDAGLGIYSAAKLYGLGFIPVCMEQYDLLIPASELESPAVQRLLSALKSPAFRAHIEALGGYELAKPGEIRARL